jgi:hypothetical protein
MGQESNGAATGTYTSLRASLLIDLSGSAQ